MTKKRNWRIAEISAALVLSAVFFLLLIQRRTTVGEAAASAPDVEVVSVEQKDLPVYREWIGTLDGMVNAAIRSQVTGYLKIARQTLSTRQESLDLKTRRNYGIATDLDLKQAEQLVDTAGVTISNLQQQTKNRITLLLGEDPAGMPSALLEWRPEIGAAEQNLIAANADVGVAKAAYFPRLSLSGLLGGQSTALSSLFNGPNSAWSFVPQLSQPIFTAGRLRANVKLAEAQRHRALVQYQKAIQTAFTEVSDALIAHQRVQQAREKQQALVGVLEERKRLAYLRYEGVDTQLNALDADRDLLQTKLDLRQIRLSELLSVVQLGVRYERRLEALSP
jgi:outer membrane protein, multidrug efflux system